MNILIYSNILKLFFSIFGLFLLIDILSNASFELICWLNAGWIYLFALYSLSTLLYYLINMSKFDESTNIMYLYHYKNIFTSVFFIILGIFILLYIDHISYPHNYEIEYDWNKKVKVFDPYTVYGIAVGIILLSSTLGLVFVNSFKNFKN